MPVPGGGGDELLLQKQGFDFAYMLESPGVFSSPGAWVPPPGDRWSKLPADSNLQLV